MDEYEKCNCIIYNQFAVCKEKPNSWGWVGRPKFKFVSASIQKPSHGMNWNLIGELGMY